MTALNPDYAGSFYTGNEPFWFTKLLKRVFMLILDI